MDGTEVTSSTETDLLSFNTATKKFMINYSDVAEKGGYSVQMKCKDGYTRTTADV